MCILLWFPLVPHNDHVISTKNQRYVTLIVSCIFHISQKHLLKLRRNKKCVFPGSWIHLDPEVWFSLLQTEFSSEVFGFGSRSTYPGFWIQGLALVHLLQKAHLHILHVMNGVWKKTLYEFKGPDFPKLLCTITHLICILDYHDCKHQLGICVSNGTVLFNPAACMHRIAHAQFCKLDHTLF